MADPLYATNRFTGDGTTTQFEISFSGGYMDKSHVKAYIENTITKARTAVSVTAPMFIGPYTLALGVSAPIGSTMVIYRDTPKDLPLVDFVNGSRVTEANLDKVAKQAVFVSAETYDTTRVGEVVAVLTAAGAAAEAAALAAAASQVSANLSSLSAAADAASAAVSATTAEGFSVQAGAYSIQANDSASQADADRIVVESIAADLAGGTIGFTAAAYDFGSVLDDTTYFNRDFGTII